MTAAEKRREKSAAPPISQVMEWGDRLATWFLSERDGWMHLYTLDVSADGARAMAVR